MMKNDLPQHAHLLLHCEEKGIAPAYIYREEHNIVALTTAGEELFLVSDLHMGAGVQRDGMYTGTENFFADGSMQRFLEFADAAKKTDRALLVINGDFIDFLRIVDVPKNDRDFEKWKTALNAIGMSYSVQELRASITPKECTDGLKTHDFKSVWKLHCCVKGHPAVFDALAAWLGKGNQVIVVKGNHDLEWYWLAVRNYLRYVLAQRWSTGSKQTMVNALRKRILPNLRFIDDAFVLDETIYVEHGHRYDKFSRVISGPTLLKKDKELNIPFGSFFNRYLLNKLELIYPFMDNVRPRGNILHMLMRERFFLGIRVLFNYVPFTLKMIPKRYYQFMLKPLVSYLLALGIPLLLVVVLWGNRIASASMTIESVLSGPFAQLAGGLLKDTGLLFLSYLFSRLVSRFQLDEPSSLQEPAKRLMQEFPQYRYFTMGHTHNPEQYEDNGRWYINSSTWIPIIESSSAALREDKTYAVVHLARNQQGQWTAQPLLQWNDDAARLDPMVIMERK